MTYPIHPSTTSTPSIYRRTSFARLIGHRRGYHYGKYRSYQIEPHPTTIGGAVDDVTSVLAFIGIQTIHLKLATIHLNPNLDQNNNNVIKGVDKETILSIKCTNLWYNCSSFGTLGPCTVSYQRYTRKGDRTLSRSRLEVCPAIASSIAANCKPVCSFLAICQEPTLPFLTVNNQRDNLTPNCHH